MTRSDHREHDCRETKTSSSRGLFLCHSDSKGDGKYLWGSQILCKWPRPGEYFYLFLVWLTYIVKDFNFLHLRTLLLQLAIYLLQTGLIQIFWLKIRHCYGDFWLDSDSKTPHKSEFWGIECNFEKFWMVIVVVKSGYINIGDGCWRWLILVTFLNS